MNTEPRCVLLLVHGLGTHSGRWDAMVNFFLKKSMPSYTVNLPKFNRIHDYYPEILRLREIAAKDNPGKKIFLIGESLGGLASFLFAAKHPELFNELVLISPAFAGRKAMSFPETVKMVAPILYDPARQVSLPFDSSMCTRDIDYRKKMDKDPLEHRSAPVKLVLDILKAQIQAKAVLKKVNGSVLFLVAGEDMIVDTGVSRKIFEGLGTEDKTFLEFPGMYHALSIELDKEVVFEELFNWINKRV